MSAQKVFQHFIAQNQIGSAIMLRYKYIFVIEMCLKKTKYDNENPLNKIQISRDFADFFLCFWNSNNFFLKKIHKFSLLLASYLFNQIKLKWDQIFFRSIYMN